ncbi:hypothetical protein GH714_001028 [Hevea brasiliensis]|uniref:Uncharacterized protein n=1 Tax=Hevea brasiliensis TaxID=3981 RepID=A0A6A6LU61_HEVBR|nr:hypothetical protein GH714_001028 [Hevea brasiliensis]
MVSRNRSNQNRSSQNQQDRTKSRTSTGINKSTYKCTHCDQPGHTKDRSFEIVGYPKLWDHNRDSRKRNASKASPTGAPASKISTVEIKINSLCSNESEIGFSAVERVPALTVLGESTLGCFGGADEGRVDFFLFRVSYTVEGCLYWVVGGRCGVLGGIIGIKGGLRGLARWRARVHIGNLGIWGKMGVSG